MHLAQLSLLHDPEFDSSNLHFKSLSSLLCYVQYLTSTKIEHNEMELSHGSDSLKNTHIGNSVLLFDKYIDCSIPSPELEFLLESQGIQDYHAWLDPEFQFKHSICTNEEVISEIFSPQVQGDHYNPYIRFKSCISSASRTCSQLMDLVGLEIKDISDINPHDNIFLDVVCTFPKSIDYYLMNPECRIRAPRKISKNGKAHKSERDIKPIHLIDRMNRCRKKFFNKLNSYLTYDPDQVLGCSTSLHIWSSEVPILPNSHVHNLISFFSYHKNRFTIPELAQDVFDELGEVVVAVNNPQIRDVVPGKILFDDITPVEKFIVDRDRYNYLRLSLSNRYMDHLLFNQCVWNGPSFTPIDANIVKELWSDVVYEEFQDFMDGWELLDVHIAWIPWYNKSKLLHALQYKIRPPVLDLDLFFKKCPGVIPNYNKIDTSIILDYLEYQLQVAVNCSNYPDICRYESLLNKAEELFANFSDDDLYSWLQFLSTWVTDTRVYGFWKNLRRYMLDPDHKVLIEEVVCPICGGSITSTNLKTQFCSIDYVFIRTRSKFLVYNVKGPPPEVLNNGNCNYE